jgi:hypothetical protein
MTERQVVMHDEAESVHFRILVAILLLCPQLQKQRFFVMTSKFKLLREFFLRKKLVEAFLLFSYNVRRKPSMRRVLGLHDC